MAPLVIAAGLLIAVFATSNRGSPYADSRPFVGCYQSSDGNKLRLSENGHIVVNGVAAGSYRVLAPVGGKHGYLVEAEGLELELNEVGHLIAAQSGHGGFFWDTDGKSLRVIFAPSSEIAFQRAPGGNC
jgi:hypothetical protein